MTVPYLSLGCHNLTAGSSRARSERLVRSALDLGITRFDVAPSYGLGTAERMLGDALGARRTDPDIEITTKFGILPPRHGALKAWLREPVRLARRLSGRTIAVDAARTVPALSASAATGPAPDPNADPRTPEQAVERSLRALRVERLGVLLTHEAVAPARHADVLHGLSALQQAGKIGRFGHSGELANVAALLDNAARTDRIAQVSVFDMPKLPPASEVRGFNFARLAHRLLADPLTLAALLEEFKVADMGTAISAALGWAHRAYPNAILLINASTPERLAAVVAPLADGGLSRWLDANGARVAALVTSA